MAMTGQSVADTPRWKTILDDLTVEVESYAYGDRFYTITEVCQKFEVSTTTAIRVLNELSSAGLIEKIPSKGNVVRRLNSPAAVHLLVPMNAGANYLTYEPMARRLTQGMRAYAEQQSIEFHSLYEKFLPNFALQRDKKFGFLLMPQTSRQTLAYLRKHNVPHVFVNQHQKLRRTANAHVNWEQAGRLATQHLLELGHRRIGFVAGRIELRHNRSRLNGYRQMLREAGIAFKWSLVRQVTDPDGSKEEVSRRFGELMDLPSPPTAVVAATDFSAIYMLEECQRRGLRVPEDVSIVGYPNHAESGMTEPALTAVDARFEEVSRVAISLLLEQILNDADSCKQLVAVEPELVIRASTGPAAQTISSTP